MRKEMVVHLAKKLLGLWRSNLLILLNVICRERRVLHFLKYYTDSV